ncbi:MAG: DUF58 domain-containing protein [Chloroflexaceae bacterium]|nr:DUF58 domain-containing protein [Chloroflexaceae bacterium]
MWFKNIFHRRSRQPSRTVSSGSSPLFDEGFLRRLERLSLQAQKTLRGNPISGEHPGRHALPSSIFSDYRPYTVGDDIRYIDWNVYAGHNDLVLKLGEADQEVDIHLLLDVSRSMAWGNPPKLRVVLQLAGTLGYLSLTHSDRVHVVPFGSSALRPFGPARGKGRLMELLRYLEAVPYQQHTDLRAILHQHARACQRGGILVLCSDLLVSEGLNEGLQMLRPPRWQVMVFHMIDPQELVPSLHGPLDLVDSETGQQLSLMVNETLREAYRQKTIDWQEHLATTCARHGASYVPMLTTWPLERKIVPFLRTRRFLA